LGESADGGAGGVEAVAAGGGEVFSEAEGGERVGLRVSERGGREAAEELGDEHDEAADEGRLGVGAEIAEAIAELADEPDDGDAAADAVGIGALGGRERRDAFRAVDHEGEALLRIVDDGEILNELFQFARERHAGSVCVAEVPARSRKSARNRAAGEAVSEAQRRRRSARPMLQPPMKPKITPPAENVLIPLTGFELPGDFPWRIGFVGLVNDQLKKLRATGHFLPPRFFGYYFQQEVPVAVGGSWTVSLDPAQPVTVLSQLVERLTHGVYSIASAARDAAPDFMLVHDRRDGACWLWSFGAGLRFVEAYEPTAGGDDCQDADQPRLLGP